MRNRKAKARNKNFKTNFKGHLGGNK